jgi:hypothetical protein
MKEGKERSGTHITSGKWVIFLPQKQVKAGVNMVLDLYYGERCFWTKAVVAFGPLWLAFAKAKAGWKAQPNMP